jgi:purine-nucleoside phosphorylase
VSPAFDAFRSSVAGLDPANQLVALVLGSGMAPVVDRIQQAAAISFAYVPGLVPPTVAGHTGQIIAGTLADRPVLAFTGRLHFYEGHAWERVVRPVEIAAELGAKVLVLTNASGGISESLAPGSLMALTNHIEWNRPRAWTEPRPGERPSPYSSSLRERLRQAASEAGVELHTGVYTCVTGPSYETPADIRALQAAGADAVGMSTAHEAETAAALGVAVGTVKSRLSRALGRLRAVMEASADGV